MDALVSPHSAALTRAVSNLYAVFDAGQVLPDLEVCRCPVCVDTPEAYAQLTTIAPKDWSVDLIHQYSNSAHGVPDNHDHLRAILPRYFEIIAADELVDAHGMGTELLRFGDAWRQDPAFLNAAQQDALRTWLMIALDHFIWLDSTKDGAIHTANGLIEMFLIGGWPVADLRSIVASKMDQPLFVCSMAVWLTRRMTEKPAGFAPHIFGLQYLPKNTLLAFFDWINDPAFCALFAEFATAPDANDQYVYSGQVSARRFMAIAGQYNADLIDSAR